MKEVKRMLNLFNLILNSLAVFAEKAAEFSAGTASHGGMYEPRMPEGLKK